MTVNSLLRKPSMGHAAVSCLVACSAPIVKHEAFDPSVLAQSPLPASQFRPQGDGETKVVPGIAWMSLDTQDSLVFAGYRPNPGELRYCLVLESDAQRDRLVLLPILR